MDDGMARTLGNCGIALMSVIRVHDRHLDNQTHRESHIECRAVSAPRFRLCGCNVRGRLEIFSIPLLQ